MKTKQTTNNKQQKTKTKTKKQKKETKKLFLLNIKLSNSKGKINKLN